MALHLGRFVCRQAGDAAARVEVILDQNRMSFRIDHLVSIDAEALHVPVARRNAARADAHDSRDRSRQLVLLRQRDSVPGRDDHRRRECGEGEVRGREALAAEIAAAVREQLGDLVEARCARADRRRGSSSGRCRGSRLAKGLATGQSSDSARASQAGTPWLLIGSSSCLRCIMCAYMSRLASGPRPSSKWRHSRTTSPRSSGSSGKRRSSGSRRASAQRRMSSTPRTRRPPRSAPAACPSAGPQRQPGGRPGRAAPRRTRFPRARAPSAPSRRSG